jgi:hypothetical protein
MVRRLLIGMVFGLIVGGLVAAGMVGLHMTELLGAGGAVLAYVSAAVTGTLTGLVTGKPIWASNAKIEAGLKATFGAIIGVGLMFALRQWGSWWTPDLTFVGAGSGPVGSLPAASLPLIAAVLGAFFGLDNTDVDEADERGRPAAGVAREGDGQRKRVAAQGANGKGKARALESGERDVGDEAVESAPGRAKR